MLKGDDFLSLIWHLVFVGKTERQQEYGDSGDLGDDFGYLKLGDSKAPDVMGQTDLGELRIFGLDGFKEAAPSFSPLTFDPLQKSVHVGSPGKLRLKPKKGDIEFDGLSGWLAFASLPTARLTDCNVLSRSKRYLFKKPC